MPTQDRLKHLRQLMLKAHLDAYLVPSADEHLNEYLPEHRKHREWLSGFDGSAGDCLVLPKTAWLFVDGRYHEQVEQQVDLKHIQVSKLGKKGHESLLTKLEQLAKKQKGLRVGYDPFTLTAGRYQVYEKKLEPYQVKWVPVSRNLIDKAQFALEQSSLQASKTEIYRLPTTVAGKSVGQKLKALRASLKENHVQLMPLTKLDEIAWLFNLRGSDIPYNPVFISYAIITLTQAYLFVDLKDASRMKNVTRKALEKDIILKPYAEYASTLKSIAAKKAVLLDKNHTTQGTVRLIQSAKGSIVFAGSPVEQAKALKNPVEIQGMKEAHRAASVALVKAWKWVEDQEKAEKKVTEQTFADTLEACYAKNPAFKGLSFNTIPGAGANGAIVHYGTPDPKRALKNGDLFLFDSGAQYLGKDWAGTTDTTRTIFIGKKPTKKHKKYYTAVLKAHIDCARQVFPQGTTGAALDSITRASMWQDGLDFLHGTGHGVGAFLNVHEGPVSISSRCLESFEPGMITSIEPGYYEAGWGGIRLENLNRVVEKSMKLMTTQQPMLGFDPLIFVPFDTCLMDQAVMTPPQIQWVKTYHARILKELTPELAPAEIAWLKAKCRISSN